MGKYKIRAVKFLMTIAIVIIGAAFFTNITQLFKKPSSTFVVEKGSISYEESGTGYLIRNEVVLEENSKEKRNGPDKIRR